MPIRVHVIAGQIHRDLCEQMITHASGVLEELDAVITDVTWVPGSLEAPLAAKAIIEHHRPDAIVVFGVQAAGKTSHGEVVARVATRALVDLQVAFNIPMAIAIIGPNASLEHAAAKAEYVSQKAMRAAAHMVAVLKNLHAD